MEWPNFFDFLSVRVLPHDYPMEYFNPPLSDGSNTWVKQHIMHFTNYVYSHSKGHFPLEDVMMRLFCLSLDRDAYDWLKEDVAEGTASSFKGLLEKIGERWTMV
jgi:hypothetical protein